MAPRRSALLHRDGGDAGQRDGRPAPSSRLHHVAERQDLGMAGERQVRLHRDAARRGRGRRRTRRPASTQRRSGDARPPTRRCAPRPARSRRRAVEGDRALVELDDRRARAGRSTPRRVERARAPTPRGRGGKAVSARSAASTSSTRRGRVDGAEVAPQRLAGDLGDLAGQLDAGRAGAHDHEREPGLAARRVRLASAASKAQQDAAADLEGVLERLQAGRERLATRRCRSRSGARRRRRSACRRAAARRAVAERRSTTRRRRRGRSR